MKRIGNLFEKIFSQENLYLAYLDARKGKRKKRACFEFEADLGKNLNSLYNEIHSGNYKPQPYFKFFVYEPKQRMVYGPAFRDIVAQHAIYRIIYSIFNQTFIDTSFACRKGYGTHLASDYTQKALGQCDPGDYTLKLDVRKFFYSIDRAILRKLIERKIKDRRLVDIMMVYAVMDTPVGIPIGNLLSQLYALIYLNPVDHFIKRILKVKRYVRYVDDMVLFGLKRERCLEYKGLIVAFLKGFLNLELSKSTIQTIRKGVNFVGYRTWGSRRFIRKFSLANFRKCLRKEKLQSIISLLGHARRTCSLRYMLLTVRKNSPDFYKKLPIKYRRLCHV